jgi:signal peptidase II
MVKFWDKYWVLLIPLILFIIDRIFKTLSLFNVKAQGFLFDFVFVKNTGISWGLFAGNSFFLLGLSLILFGIILYFYNSLLEYKLGLTLLIFGALSNILDRIFFGFVIDYIDFGFFPVFNLADACIVLGGFWIVFVLAFNKKV